MPATHPTSEGTPSDDLLLAALERAERHERRENQGVLLVHLKDHLGLPHHSGSTLRLRPQLDRLQHTGLIERERQQSRTLWKLTPAGRSRLRRARRTGELVLPDSPQHRKWATAQLIAEERIAELRGELRRTLDQAAAMLEDKATTSDAWFSLIPKLKTVCQRLATATYILGEWDEPDDSRPDIDPYPHRDRRNIHAWGE
jgi:DNA-binding PadR family transcriptional regulator